MMQVEVAAKKERLNDLQGELRALETRHARFRFFKSRCGGCWWSFVNVPNFAVQTSLYSSKSTRSWYSSAKGNHQRKHVVPLP